VIKDFDQWNVNKIGFVDQGVFEILRKAVKDLL